MNKRIRKKQAKRRAEEALRVAQGKIWHLENLIELKWHPKGGETMTVFQTHWVDPASPYPLKGAGCSFCEAAKNVLGVESDAYPD